MKILLCVNRRCDPDLSFTESLRSFLALFSAETDILIPFDVKDPKERLEIVRKHDILITVGGDGTVLKMAPHAAEAGVPVIGINRGRLGFLTEIDASRNDLLEKLFTGYETEERMMLQADVIRNNETVASFTALNDVLVRTRAVNRTTHIKTLVDGSELMDYIGDGVIAATPTGSTGYSFSAGGMIVDPSLSCILITPLLAHSSHVRGHIVSDTVSVDLRILKPANILIIDGTAVFDLEDEDEIRIRKSEKNLCLIRINDTGFYQKSALKSL